MLWSFRIHPSPWLLIVPLLDRERWPVSIHFLSVQTCFMHFLSHLVVCRRGEGMHVLHAPRRCCLRSWKDRHLSRGVWDFGVPPPPPLSLSLQNRAVVYIDRHISRGPRCIFSKRGIWWRVRVIKKKGATEWVSQPVCRKTTGCRQTAAGFLMTSA